MYWNWNTVGACFFAEIWKVESEGGFAGLCIGIIITTMLFECIRQLGPWYTKHISQVHSRRRTTSRPMEERANAGSAAEEGHAPSSVPFRPSFGQHLALALIHTLQFVLGYFIMLMAMYYNGYIIICIMVGTFLGYVLVRWRDEVDPSALQRPGSSSSTSTGCHG
ncbi:hypothetical protein PG984_004724 [Apiospora sp. TS-2023a]